MKMTHKSWWYLFGVVAGPYFLLVFLLRAFELMPLDTGLGIDLGHWIWFSLVVSLATGVSFIWRLPLHWFLRLDFSVLYIVFVGYSLIMMANNFAANFS